MRPAIFDLDGTLADSAPVIAACFAEVERDLRGIDRPAGNYLWCCGPPLVSSFLKLGWDDPEQGVAAFRALYRQRMAQTQLFAGAADMLARLAADGCLIALATSKLEGMADWMLGHLGVRGHFAAICGVDESDRAEGKSHVIARAVEALRAAGAKGEPIMVGDRSFDVEGARVNGLQAVACRWGGADDAEFKGAWRVVATFKELEDALRSA